MRAPRHFDPRSAGVSRSEENQKVRAYMSLRDMRPTAPNSHFCMAEMRLRPAGFFSENFPRNLIP
jgi:hypothetical protein